MKHEDETSEINSVIQLTYNAGVGVGSVGEPGF